MVPKIIEDAILQLVRNAGDKLIVNIFMPTRLPASVVKVSSRDKILLNLVWPTDGDFCKWAELVVLAEELIDITEKKEILTKKLQDEKLNL